ncbi:MAG TPA: hypothetical protein VEB86_19825 [Chryseosolibacter sp.]|nr:hypothetical protein [Chryseosolibacter sp.]
MKTYSTTTNELRIAEEELRNIMNGEEAVIFIIHSTDNKLQSNPHSLRYAGGAGPVQVPYTCDLQKASVALMAGMRIETPSLYHIGEAENYYLLATRLSNAGFYGTILHNLSKEKPTRMKRNIDCDAAWPIHEESLNPQSFFLRGYCSKFSVNSIDLK